MRAPKAGTRRPAGGGRAGEGAGPAAGGYPPKGDLRRAVRHVPPAGAGRGWAPWAGAALGPAGRAGRRSCAGRGLPPGGDMAARSGRPGAAHGRAGRPVVARIVSGRPGLRGRVLLSHAVLGAERRVVRVGGAGRRLGGHPRRAGHRPAAAAAAARVAGRRGGLVGRRRSTAGPLAVGRLPVGPAGDEPGVSAERGLGRDRGRAPADVRGRAHRRRPGLADSRRPQPSPGCAVAAGAGPGRGGGGGPGRRWGRAARRSGDREPDGGGRRRAGQRAARP